MVRGLSRGLVAVAVALAATRGSMAQDTRVVREPKIPAACSVLNAGLTAAQATSGVIEAQAEISGTGQAALVDTARIQKALDDCAKGTAVELAADGDKVAFLTGPIQLRAGVVLLVDKGVTLYGTRNPEYYAVTPGSCGVVNDDSASGCRPLIAVVNATGAGIMGEGAIDGQGGARLMVDGKAAAKSWWDLAEDARNAGRQQVPRMIDTDLSDDFTLYRITLRNSANFHVAFHRGDGLTVWGVKIDTPKTARNTDGIDPAQAKNITVTQSYIRTGDDNIALKAGDGPTTNVSIVHNHFYWGHGVSIGSETNGGVSGVRVTDLTLDGPDNGIRIKSNASRGGLVDDVVYEDVCIRDSKDPIFFDTTYTFPGKAVGMIPVYRDITLRDVRIAGGGRIQLNGFDTTHRIGVTLDGVVTLDGEKAYKASAIHTDLALGPGPMNFVFTGDDSTVTGQAGSARVEGCGGKFVGFP
jgi:polygalacturonase